MRDWAHSRRLGTPADEAGYVVLRQPPASKLANLFRIDVRDHALGLVTQQLGGRVLPRQESFASLHILTRRASEGSEGIPLAGASGSYELLRCQGNNRAPAGWEAWATNAITEGRARFRIGTQWFSRSGCWDRRTRAALRSWQAGAVQFTAKICGLVGRATMADPLSGGGAFSSLSARC